MVMDQADAYFTAGPITTPYDVTLRDGGIMGLNFPDSSHDVHGQRRLPAA